MINKVWPLRASISVALIIAIWLTSVPAAAQGPDLVQVNDLTGGSSVFVFRNSAKAAPKRFATTAKPSRSKAQRLEAVSKIKKQFETRATTDPGRARAKVVEPGKIPPSAKTMPKDKASILFAGVGEYYIDHGLLDDSVDVFREAVALDDKNVTAHLGLSDALARKGNDLLVKDQAVTAKAYFLEALKNNPKNSAAYFGLGAVYSDLDQNAEAIASYEKSLENDKNLTEIYVPLGILYYQNGEIAKADEMLTKAMTISAGTADTQLFLGLIRYSQNRNKEALEAFHRAESIDPTYAEAFFRSGETLVRLQRWKDAIAAYQQAISLRANYFEAFLGLAEANFELENYAEAISAYTAAKKLKNDKVEVFAGLGDAYRLAGKYNDAEANYNLATSFISRDPNFNKDEAAEIYSKIGYVIGRQCAINMKQFIACKWPAAIKALEKGVELGGNPMDYANLGWAYYNAARIDFGDKREADGRAKLELAKTNLQKAIAAKPSFVAGPLLNLGMTLTDLGDYVGAVDALTKAVENEPKWVFALNELGIAYRKQNKLKEAANQFRRATEKDDQFAAAYFNLAEAEFKAGNKVEAKKAYEKLKTIGRNDLATQLEVQTGGAIRR